MKKILTIIVLLAIGTTTLLQAQSHPETYNYTMAQNAFIANDDELAYEYLLKEIEENSDNGYAYILLSNIHFRNMLEMDEGYKYLKLAEKHISKNDSVAQTDLYTLFGYYYNYVDCDFKKSLKYCNKGLTYNSSHTPLYQMRVFCRIQLGDLEGAIADMEKIVEYNPYSIEQLIDVCELYFLIDDYASALKHLEYIKSFDNTSETRLYYEILCKIKLKKYIQSLHDITQLIAQHGYNDDIEFLINLVGKEDFKTTESILKHYSQLYKGDLQYDLALANLYRSHRQFEKAIECYNSHLGSSGTNEYFIHIAQCYVILGNNEMALEYLNHYMLLNPDDLSALEPMCNVLCYMGRHDEALELIDKIAKGYEEEIYDYLFNTIRFSIYYMKQDYATALNIYDIVSEYSYDDSILAEKGRLYALMGEEKLAEKCYKEAIKQYEQNDNVGSILICYAYIHMGKEKKALAVIEKALASDEYSQLYNVACAYALMNDSENAIKYLEKAILNEDTDRYWMTLDPDLESIRHLDEFKELINKYF